MEKHVQTKREIPNKYVYVAFLVAAITFVLMKDFSSAIIFAGIGLVFDPFDQSMPYNSRPVWQRIWLMVHCIFVLVVLALLIAYP